jgi:hypothetical protein
MVEIIANQEINKDIQEQTSSQNQDKEDLNFLVQEKCKENQIGEEEQKNITIFFKNIENKIPKEYQNDLLNYIKNINGNDFFLLSIASDFEKINEEKKIIDQIDLKQKQPIITYSEIEGQKSEIDTREKLSEETKKLLEQAEKDYNQLLKDKPELEPDQQQLDKQKQELEQNESLQKLKDL